MSQTRSRRSVQANARAPEVAPPEVAEPAAAAEQQEGATPAGVLAVGEARGNQAAAAFAAPRTPARPAGDNNPWIPDFIEDWIWGPEEQPAGGGPTPTPAPRSTAWWDAMQAETDAGRREQLVVAETTAGRMQGHFDELDRTQRLGAYRERFQEALDFYQLHATLGAAGGRTEAQLAQTQGDHMAREEERVVQAQAGTGHAPTQAERDQARADLNEQDYVTPPAANQLVWPNLSPADQAAWQARGATARSRLVAWIVAQHPEYAIRIDQIVVDFGEVERLGAVAFNDGSDHCTIGFTVVEAVEQNPEFAVSTVIHELFGHNEFDRGFSVTERLFREAVARQRGVRPEDVQLTDDEWSRFNYFESEIASLVWEYDLYVGSDAQGHTNPLGSPQDLMVSLMRNLQSQWASDLIVPLFTGLFRRFQADPALSDAAAEFFRSNAERHLGISLR